MHNHFYIVGCLIVRCAEEDFSNINNILLKKYYLCTNCRTMKRFLAFFVSLLTFAVATAQEQHSIIIDPASFRPINSNAITGVNIDPIGLDSSRRPCARIKVKINRMSREDINKLEVKIRSNNELTKCKTAEYDNGLIIEMTAKLQSRFYFFHPEFGYSNEVQFDLDANKEYYLEASLNQTYSIIVSCNVVGADVYLDNVFKGRTGDNCSLTVSEVIIGEHALGIKYGNIKQEQTIDVNKNSIAFHQNINIAASEPQFVVFAVEPQSAVVIIGNKHYTLTEGAMRVVLPAGNYNYTVTAAGYHSQSGTFAVAGDKVTKQIALTADAATVTLTAPDGAEIWVNEEYKGKGSWSGVLNSGTYIFEARKQGHKSGVISKQITSTRPTQSYALPAPQPIYGSLMVDGTPLMADVALDGTPIGQTPLKKGGILIGNHTLTISKSGYDAKTQSVTITEGQTAVVDVTLTKQATSELKGVTPIKIDTSLSAEQLNSKGWEYYDKKDYNSAVQYFYQAAKRGHAISQRILGYCYHNGLGLAKDYNQAVMWYGKSADQGDSWAQNNLGVCYRYGLGVAQNYNEAVKWYRKAAEQGNVDAQCDLGYCIERGLGVTKDITEAVKWYRKAADQSNAVAQSNLGWCYQSGLGVTKDEYEAVKWYRKAVEQGYARAQCNLGYCYDEGLGVTKDEYEAVKWYRKAAEQGYAVAQYNLGQCYRVGRGVTKNITEAVKWYRKAAEQGYEDAKKRLTELGY